MKTTPTPCASAPRPPGRRHPEAGQTAEYELGGNRRAYLVPAVGKVEVNGIELLARDGAAIADEAVVKVTALEDSEVILVDVA